MVLGPIVLVLDFIVKHNDIKALKATQVRCATESHLFGVKDFQGNWRRLDELPEEFCKSRLSLGQDKDCERERPPQGKQDPVPVSLEEEMPSFLKKVVTRYGRGGEFKARDTFKLISAGYLEEFANSGVYCVNWEESATLQILEALLVKGDLRNKRRTTVNEFGDEEWYYTVR